MIFITHFFYLYTFTFIGCTVVILDLEYDRNPNSSTPFLSLFRRMIFVCSENINLLRERNLEAKFTYPPVLIIYIIGVIIVQTE